IRAAVQEYDLPGCLHDLTRSTHPRHPLRLAVEGRIEHALLVRQLFHLREELRFVFRLVRRGRAVVHLDAIEPLEDVVAFRVDALERQQPADRLSGLDGRRKGRGAPDAVEIDRLGGGNGRKYHERGEQQRLHDYFLASSSPSQSSTLWPSANVIFRMNA